MTQQEKITEALKNSAATLSKIAGIPIELLTLQNENTLSYTITFDEDNQSIQEKIKKYLGNTVEWGECGFDDICECTFMYFNIKRPSELQEKPNISIMESDDRTILYDLSVSDVDDMGEEAAEEMIKLYIDDYEEHGGAKPVSAKYISKDEDSVYTFELTGDVKNFIMFLDGLSSAEYDDRYGNQRNESKQRRPINEEYDGLFKNILDGEGMNNDYSMTVLSNMYTMYSPMLDKKISTQLTPLIKSWENGEIGRSETFSKMRNIFGGDQKEINENDNDKYSALKQSYIKQIQHFASELSYGIRDMISFLNDYGGIDSEDDNIERILCGFDEKQLEKILKDISVIYHDEFGHEDDPDEAHDDLGDLQENRQYIFDMMGGEPTQVIYRGFKKNAHVLEIRESKLHERKIIELPNKLIEGKLKLVDFLDSNGKAIKVGSKVEVIDEELTYCGRTGTVKNLKVLDTAIDLGLAIVQSGKKTLHLLTEKISIIEEDKNEVWTIEEFKSQMLANVGELYLDDDEQKQKFVSWLEDNEDKLPFDINTVLDVISKNGGSPLCTYSESDIEEFINKLENPEEINEEKPIESADWDVMVKRQNSWTKINKESLNKQDAEHMIDNFKDSGISYDDIELLNTTNSSLRDDDVFDVWLQKWFTNNSASKYNDVDGIFYWCNPVVADQAYNELQTIMAADGNIADSFLGMDESIGNDVAFIFDSNKFKQWEDK